jgi:hypothetical protein
MHNLFFLYTVIVCMLMVPDDEKSGATKGAIPFKEATGVCYFHNVEELNADGKAVPTKRDNPDLKFAIFTPQRIWMLAFSKEDEDHGLSLLKQLYGVLKRVDVLAKGWISKKRNAFAPPGSMMIWKKRYFVYVDTGELLYFSDETLSNTPVRVNVRHSPRLRVNGGGGSFAPCLVSIAVPNGKVRLNNERENWTDGFH